MSDSTQDNLNSFSGRLFAAFLTLAQSEQFKLAADRLNVTPSAFSQMISRLEEQMGVRLFDRNTRHVSLTPEGQMLVPAIKGLSIDIDALFATVRDHAQRRQGKVSIAALPSLCADWMPRVIAAYHERYPNIRIRLFDAVPDQIVDLLRRGVIDYAINARLNNPEEFDSNLLFKEDFYFVCPRSHPLAGKTTVTLRSLTGLPYIHSLLSGSIWHWIQPHMRDVKFEDTGLEVVHMSTLAGLIFNGMGVSIVPAFGLDQFFRLGLVAIPIRDKGLHRPLLLVKRRGQSLSVAAEALLAMISEFPPGEVLHRAAAKH